jgi:hypothetical protein
MGSLYGETCASENLSQKVWLYINLNQTDIGTAFFYFSLTFW